MRNLFSFVLDLLSSLLFGLVQGVLLLDRLICWVYDLPLWAGLARAFHFVQKRRALCAFTLFVPVFFVPCAVLTQPGTLVVANGRPLGLVAEASAVPDTVAALEQSAGRARRRGLHPARHARDPADARARIPIPDGG